MPKLPENSARVEEQFRHNYLVVIKRETDPPEVTPFDTEEEAFEFFDRWSAQWSESYLCKVLRGPRV